MTINGCAFVNYVVQAFVLLPTPGPGVWLYGRLTKTTQDDKLDFDKQENKLNERNITQRGALSRYPPGCRYVLHCACQLVLA